MDVQFTVDVLKMLFDSAARNDELTRNFLVRESFACEHQYIKFALAERFVEVGCEEQR